MPRNPSIRTCLAALVAVAVLVPSLARASLVAYWSFDGCSTTDAVASHDLSTGGSPVCASGVLGTAWTLDGSSQYFERVDAAFSPGARPWTVTAWVRSNADTTLNHVIVAWYRCGATPECHDYDAALWSLFDVHGRTQWDVRDDNGSDNYLIDSTVAIADHRWHFVVGTMSAAHDTIELYVDGVRRKAKATAMTTVTGTPPIEIGRWYRTGWGSPDYYYDGTIDEVRICDERLSASAIAALYAAGTASVPGRSAGGTMLTLDRLAPNPVRGASVRLAFTTADATPVRVTVLDVTGRRVSERVLELASAGPHTLELDGGAVSAPGVYLVQLAQGATTVSRRVTVLR